MSGKFFVDTNVLIYALGKEADRQEKAIRLLENRPHLSTQILTECCNVCLKKLNFSQNMLKELIGQLQQNSEIVAINVDIITKALDINKKYKFSFYDSLVIAAALSSECQILFSEDMQHQQVIEGLTIINPFL